MRINATQRYSYEYVFIHSDPDGFWFIPKPIYTLPLTGVSHKYGYFGVLYSPTITKSQVHGQPDGRYLTVVSDIFPTTRYFKWDTLTLLPSVEYKTR